MWWVLIEGRKKGDDYFISVINLYFPSRTFQVWSSFLLSSTKAIHSELRYGSALDSTGLCISTAELFNLLHIPMMQYSKYQWLQFSIGKWKKKIVTTKGHKNIYLTVGRFQYSKISKWKKISKFFTNRSESRSIQTFFLLK